jgi:hypothetical protein
VAIVNQALVRRYWSKEKPIGKRIRLATRSAFFEVIGVTPDLQDPNGPFNSVRPPSISRSDNESFCLTAHALQCHHIKCNYSSVRVTKGRT